MRTDFSMTSSVDGTELTAHAWGDQGRDARASLVIAHGAGEHALRYGAFAEAACAHGLSVFALDHRGHGPGAPRLGDFGRAGWPGLVADLAALCAHVAEQAPGAPTILFGHSMGSLAAQQLMVDRSRLLDAVVLSGTTCFDLLAAHLAASGSAGLEAFNAAFDTAETPAPTPFEWLSRDRSEVDRYEADPLCGTDLNEAAVGGMFSAAMELADPAVLRRIRSDLPVLIVAGDADPLNDDWSMIETLRARYAAAGLEAMTVHRLAGARHEVLNEIDRDTTTKALLDWIDGTIAQGSADQDATRENSASSSRDRAQR